MLSKQALAVLDGLDASAALALPGVVGILSAADIPGANAVFDAPLLAGEGAEQHCQIAAIFLSLRGSHVWDSRHVFIILARQSGDDGHS